MNQLPLTALLAPMLAPLLLIAGTGCHEDLERFDAGDDNAFCGSIVQSDFIREGYAGDLTMRLTLDIEQLDFQPGTLSLQDADTGPCSPLATFDRASLHTTPSLFGDPLSELQFGRSREHNFMSWVDPQCGPSALAVISLMHDNTVEVRLLSRGGTSSEQGDFGFFQLTRGTCEE